MILTIVFWVFIPGKMQSQLRYVVLMVLFGLPAAFAFIGIGAFVMIIKLFHNQAKKHESS